MWRFGLAAAGFSTSGWSQLGRSISPSKNCSPCCCHVHAVMAWGDVAVDQGRPPSSIRVFLKVSKCDQFGRGVAVFVGATSHELCPVAALLGYVTARGDREGPFFLLQNGTPLIKARFISGVRQALIQAGIPYQNYSGHSFRIGAATAASQASLSDSTIQALGRWSSAAFLRYIHTPRSQLAQYSRAMVARH